MYFKVIDDYYVKLTMKLACLASNVYFKEIIVRDPTCGDAMLNHETSDILHRSPEEMSFLLRCKILV